jgi:hypothetical protein
MAMNIGEFLLVAVGGYVAYELFIAPAAATTTTTTTTPATTTAPAVTAPPAAPLSSPVTTQAGILALANAETPPLSMATADTWGALYAQVRGAAAPNPGGYLPADTPQAAAGYLFSLPEWCGDSGLCGIVPMERGFGDYLPAPRLSVFELE